MGQAKIKSERKSEKLARASTIRLHMVKIEAQFVAYDEYGRAQNDGTGAAEPFFLMEADAPPELVAVIRKRFPKLEFVTIKSTAEAQT